MSSIAVVLNDLDERTIAQRVSIPHDEARNGFRLGRNTVDTFEEFSDILGDYYDHHHSACVSHGGHMSHTEAAGRAKEIVENYYQRRRGGDIATAFGDAHEGTNGGLGSILDIIAQAIEEESVERYIRAVFDQQVAPNSWDDQVEIIRQFIDRCGMHLSPGVRSSEAERYARDYQKLIRSYVDGLKNTSGMFRRLR